MQTLLVKFILSFACLTHFTCFIQLSGLYWLNSRWYQQITKRWIKSLHYYTPLLKRPWKIDGNSIIQPSPVFPVQTSYQICQEEGKNTSWHNNPTVCSSSLNRVKHHLKINLSYINIWEGAFKGLHHSAKCHDLPSQG